MHNLIGMKFGRLTVIEFSHVCNGGNAYWRCKCECGKTSIASAVNLKTNHTKSCGCLQKEIICKLRFKHGMRHTKLYNCWSGMFKRCENPNCKEFKYYGARGISICRKWRNSKVFFSWALSHNYRPGLTLDRINSQKSYKPSNCQWLTKSENSKKSWVDRRDKLTIEEAEKKIC
jgi:hypothetical protein